MPPATASTPGRKGIPCPACGASLVVNPSLRRKKVQCPKCREVIILPETTLPAKVAETLEVLSAPPPAPPVAEAAEARLLRLEERVMALEREVAELKARKEAAPPPAPAGPVAPPVETQPLPASTQRPPGFRDWRTLAEPQPTAPEPAPAPPALLRMSVAEPEALGLKSAVDDEIVRALLAVPGGKVAIRRSTSDSSTVAFCGWLKRLFADADWTVAWLEGQPETPTTQSTVALVMSSQVPSPKTASAIHHAFSVAGLGLLFEFDPTNTSTLPILNVPRQPANLATQPPFAPAAPPAGEVAAFPHSLSAPARQQPRPLSA